MGRHGGDGTERHGGGGARRPRLRRWAIGTGLGVGVVAVAMALVMYGFPLGADGDKGGSDGRSAPTTDPNSPRAQVGWGFTHTQYSADRGTGEARAEAARLLSADPMPQNQHIMGWGAQNPEPRPGRYDFKDLDRRIALIRRTGGTPVITLCCAPDWMKGGKPGATDWRTLEKAPSPAHYEDFAKLAGVVARRYRDVKHFVVWNEFKGFFDEDKKRWDYEGYTRLYNLVYWELKGIDASLQVGGPYVVMDSYAPDDTTYASGLRGPWGSVDRRTIDAIEYWNENKAGADFVVVDGSSYTKDDRYVPDEFAATRKFADVGRWLRRTTKLPLWWAEWYVEVADGNDDRNGWAENHRTAVQAAALIEMARGGATSGFYWNPENENGDCPGCLWSSTQLQNGGAQLPMMRLLSRFGREFPPGTPLRTVEIAADDRPNVRVLADDTAVLVVNTLDRPIQARVDGQRFTMAGYEIRWLKRT